MIDGVLAAGAIGPAVRLAEAAPRHGAANVPAGAVLGLLLLAMAVLTPGGRPGRGRLRELGNPAAEPAAGPVPQVRRSWIVIGAVAVGALAWTFAGPAGGVVAGGSAGLAAGLAARAATTRPDRVGAASGDLAGRWELLAVCLEAGLPVASAVEAATASLDGPVGQRLRRVGGLLTLGADPVEAWASAAGIPALAAFARAAGRSAGTGAALAHVARAEAVRLRADLLDSAQARAQRAAVLITGPLGLCFLPAFLALGIAPVVIGLAHDVLAQW